MLVPILLIPVLFLNNKPSLPASGSVGTWGERGWVPTTDLLWSVITHQDWGFDLHCIYPLHCTVLPCPRKMGFHNCSWHIYLNIINLSCSKRFPQARGSWHHPVPGQREDLKILISCWIKIEKADKSLQILAAKRRGLAGRWGWAKLRCQPWSRGWGLPSFSVCPFRLSYKPWRCLFIYSLDTVS